MEIKELKEYLKEHKITYAELSEMSGVSISTITKIFGGFAKYPRIDTMQAIEKALGIRVVNKSILETVELNDVYRVPLLGSVVAGVPIEAQENLEGYVYISYRPAENYFALRVHGDSMKNKVPDESIVICRKQSTAESGDIIVAMLNGEQTVKRLKKHAGGVYLMPENSDYMPIPVTAHDKFIILGKVVEIRVCV